MTKRTAFAACLVLAGFLGGAGISGALNSTSGLSETELVQELQSRGWQSASTGQTDALYRFESGDVNSRE